MLNPEKLGEMKITLSDIERGSNFTLQPLRESEIDAYVGSDIKPKSLTIAQPYIKIMLRQTDDILLYEQRSLTAPRDSAEGQLVAEDNKRYEYLTQGKGKFRITVDGETQTSRVLQKSREVNTERIRKDHVGSYVSNFEMFDTYKDLDKSTESVDVNGEKKIEITTYSMHGVDTFIEINKTPNFKIALMLIKRILASNVYEKQQRRFRNMDLPDPLALQIRYAYRLELLWRHKCKPFDDDIHRAVADISVCPYNGDLLAVAYGIYSFYNAKLPSTGCVCIWNIKNPVNPERCYYYKAPVMSVEFSPFVPQLLAVGLYDGSIEVCDIKCVEKARVAISKRTDDSQGCEPIVAIKWISQSKDAGESCDIQQFLALSQNSLVVKYHIINSPHLLGSKQILLDRVEGRPEGLPVGRISNQLQANRHPQGLNLSLHPQHGDIFYLLTDEGCCHNCSTNYPHQHMGILQVHTAAVNALEFSPWSPKLFLTCGNDWCIRIWIEGILQPLITLKHGVGPIHCANWSKTHSTIIVGLNRNTVDVWDIRRSVLKPVSSTHIDDSFHTTFKFSNCGRSIAVGNEDGDVLMLAFEDMPFPPHFQHKQLEKAIFNALRNKSDLIEQLKNVGYFGYTEQRKKNVRK